MTLRITIAALCAAALTACAVQPLHDTPAPPGQLSPEQRAALIDQIIHALPPAVLHGAPSGMCQ